MGARNWAAAAEEVALKGAVTPNTVRLPCRADPRGSRRHPSTARLFREGTRPLQCAPCDANPRRDPDQARPHGQAARGAARRIERT
jgi:hypothetical protein